MAVLVFLLPCIGHSYWEIARTVRVTYSDIDEGVVPCVGPQPFRPDVGRGDSHRPRVQSAMPTTWPSVVAVGAPPPRPNKPHANSRLCKSWISLCLCMGKLPILHAIAWLTEKAPPHVQRPGTCCRCQPYRSASVFRNDPCVKANHGHLPEWQWATMTCLSLAGGQVCEKWCSQKIAEPPIPPSPSPCGWPPVHSSFEGQLEMPPSHCFMPSLIASVRVLATNFDVWCSCTLVVTRSQFSKVTKPRRESEETSRIEWYSGLTRQRRQTAVLDRLFQGSKSWDCSAGITQLHFAEKPWTKAA